MVMRRGKLVWGEMMLSVMCDICKKPRNQGNHRACSEERKKARARETVAAVKAEILEFMKHESQ